MTETHRTKTAGKKRRLFLVEDHPITREGFAQLINFQPDLMVCGQAATAGEAIKELPKANPDLVIVDISLADGNGLDLIKDLSVSHPDLPTLVLSTHDEKIYAERALRAGARGYVMKLKPTNQVLSCIRNALRGEICVSEEMRGRLLGKLCGAPQAGSVTDVDQLSDRELEVFRMLGQGHGTREIAEHLHVGISTVETYRAHIKNKLGLANAMDLVSTAVRWVEAQG